MSGSFNKLNEVFANKKMATNLKTPRIYLLITPPKESPKAIPGFSTKSKRSNPKSEMFSPK